MVEHEKGHRIGPGLPRCIGNGFEGLERLEKELGLDRNRRRVIRKLSDRGPGEPSSTTKDPERGLLFDYRDPNFRRRLWEEAYARSHHGQDKSTPGKSENLFPSLEHLILLKTVPNSKSADGGLEQIAQVFAEWPDLEQRLARNIPWVSLAAGAWAHLRERFDEWDTLDDEEREQTTLTVFAVATIVDDDRILRAAIRAVPEMKDEFTEILSSNDSSEITDDHLTADALVRWSELCRLALNTINEAAGPPPKVDVLTKFTDIVRQFEEIAPSVRERLVRDTFESLIAPVQEILADTAGDPIFFWLDDKARVEILESWNTLCDSPSNEQAANDVQRLYADARIAVANARVLAKDISEAQHQLDDLRKAKPLDAAQWDDWEEKCDELEGKTLSLRREQRQARKDLRSALSPSQDYLVSEQRKSLEDDASEDVPRHEPEAAEEADPPLLSNLGGHGATEAPVEEPVSIGSAEQSSGDDQRPFRDDKPEDENNVEERSISEGERGQKPVGGSDTGPSPDYETEETAEDEAGDSADQLLYRAKTGIVEALSETPPRVAYSFQIVRLLNEVAPTSGLPPATLFEVAMLSDHLMLPDGAVAAGLRRVLEQFPDPDRFSTGPDRDLYVLLALCGTLRPALLVPEAGAAAFLSALKPSERLANVYCLASAVAEQSWKLQGVRIDPTVLRCVDSEAAWEAERDALVAEAKTWEAQAHYKTIKYQPATKVWQTWLKAGGFINRLIQLITGARSPDMVSLQKIKDELEHQQSFEALVKRTDRVEIGRRKGDDIHAGALNQLRALALEVVELARRYQQVNDSRPAQSDFLTRTLGELRANVEHLSPPALTELDELAAGERSLLSAVANTAKQALVRFRQFVNFEDVIPHQEPEPSELLASGLFAFPRVAIDEAGTPTGDARTILESIVSPNEATSLSSAVADRLEAGDLSTAWRIVEWVAWEGSGDADELQIQLHEARTVLTRALRQQIAETSTRIAKAAVGGHIGDSERSRYDAEIVELDRRLAASQVQRFDVERAKVERISETIGESLRAKKMDVEAAFAEISLSVDDRARQRFEQLVEDGDLVTANELIDRMRHNEPDAWQEQSSNYRESFREFYPEGARSIDQALEERDGRRILEQLRSGNEFAGLALKDIPGAQRKSAREMLEAWFRLKRAGRLGNGAEGDITTLLSSLGFIVRKVAVSRSERNFGEARIETDPIQTRERCPIPGFGSLADGHYRLVFLWGRPTEEDILQHADALPGRAATIVVYLGRLTEARRDAFARMARARSRTLLVLDELLLVFLCGQRGSRMPVLFGCAIPFTFVQPYVTTASVVPPEMFFGREEEMREITDPEGASFIYGGRQLGKTALLRAVERMSHRPQQGRYSVWIDLKDERIGYDRDAGEIWLAIWRALRRTSAIPEEIKGVKEPNPNIRGRVDAFVEYLKEHFNRSAGNTLLLLLDEADKFLEIDGRERAGTATGYGELSRLKGLMDATERSVKVVFAGLHNVLRTVQAANHPLGHLGTPIEVGPLLADGGWRAAEALVREPLLAAGYRFRDENLVTRILAQTNYYPSLIQLYGAALIKGMCAGRIKGSPLYEIDESMLEETYQNTSLRDVIRSRFHLTLQLDPRYEVIAYSIAHECVQHEGLLGTGLAFRRIDDVARGWWAEGFNDIEPHTDRFRSLLDEMVGLGVLRSVGEDKDRYTLRNPNVLLFMGTSEEIEDNLLRDRQTPPEFEREVFRARDPQDPDGPSRSPMTFQQEDLLRSEKNGVSLVCGLEASGLGDVVRCLRGRGASDTVVELGGLMNGRDFEAAIEQHERQRAASTTICVTPPNLPWSEEWVQTALRRVAKLTAKGKFMQIVFMAEPGQLWQLLSEGRLAEGPELQWVSLRPWRSTFLRQWMVDVGFTDSPLAQKKIVEGTGGWKLLLERLHQLHQETGNLDESLEKLDRVLDGKDALQQRLWFGLDNPEIFNALKWLAGGEATWSDLQGLAAESGIGGDSLRRSLRWGELLHVVRRTGMDAWQMDSVVARVLHRAGD